MSSLNRGFFVQRPSSEQPFPHSGHRITVRNTQAPLPPIHRLPVELLGEIFERYTKQRGIEPFIDSNTSSLKATKFSRSNPIILGHVCHYWRSICHSMPILWSSIAVAKPRISQLATIKVWLKRAGECPLSLSLFQSYMPNPAEERATSQVLALFLTRAHLWRRIEFNFKSFRASDNALSQAHLSNLPPTPMLESVYLDMSNWDATLVDRVWHSIHALPTVRRIHWDSDYKYRGIPAHTPWSQLTHVTFPSLPGLSQDQLLETLRECHQLMELDWDITMHSESSIQTLVFRVTLPTLRALRLRVDGMSNPGPLMEHLSLPSLTSISIFQDFHSPAPRLIGWLKDLLVRSACRLEALSLSDRMLGEDELIEFLASTETQHLVKLSLMLRKITDRMAKFLTVDKETTVLLPNLQVLFLPDYDMSEGSLFSIIASRLPVLKTTRIPNSDMLLARDLPALEILLSTGCDFNLLPEDQIDGKLVERRLGSKVTTRLDYYSF